MNIELNPKVSLNLTEIEQAERHARVFSEFDGLKLGESMEVIVDHEPKLLLRQFKALRDGAYSWNVVEQSNNLYKFGLIKIQNLSREQTGTKPNGCCGICGSD